MCGIAGYIGYEHISMAEKEAILNKMLTRIGHRGPDEQGVFLSSKASFGSVRLSIIDVAGGQQPLCNEDGNLWIAYNGEVYNYIELKDLLLSKGHIFKTSCDTEVVLHLYEEFGTGCLDMLNGQFAFSVWDIKKQQLFLARDRVGIRPLFYSHQNNNILFASEIKSIFEFPGFKREISYSSLKQIFTFWTTISPHTIFSDVFELPPGHFALFTNGKLTIQKYWKLTFPINGYNINCSIKEATDQLDALLNDSIKLRLRADVPVAAYLSGGLDSSVTSYYIKKYFPDTLNTFSIGFDDSAYDETEYQSEVSRFLNTNHRSTLFTQSDVIDLFSEMMWHVETPLLRGGPIPMYKLSKLVRDNNIKVVVTGEGADEALGGYNIFKEAIIREFWSKYPDSKMRPLLLKRLYPYLPHIRNANGAMLKMFFGYKLTEISSPIYSHLLRWKNTSHIINHLSELIKEQTKEYDPISEVVENIGLELNGRSVLNRAQSIETNLFMSGYLLSSQGDRVSMGHSVEGRYPFLDHRILEFCATLPDRYKILGLNEKYLLKRSVISHLPMSVLSRPKQAYRAPIVNAFLNIPNRFIDDLFNEKKIKEIGIFDSKSIQMLLKKIKQSEIVSEIDSMSLMGILSTNELNRQFVKEFEYIGDSEVQKSKVCNR
ncbi:MAG: asparagine synthase (glutamine-hydrolyzing) [Marinilabiliaceae bacterium]|nr:asparagine synthase (glutamine-hydrolyzing) [Marinilabiliaceae bacterium]